MFAPDLEKQKRGSEINNKYYTVEDIREGVRARKKQKLSSTSRIAYSFLFA